MEDIAIVILNWNGRNFLERFLPGLIANSPGARIVVADNASTDDSVAFLGTHFPQLELVQNASNGGFAQGYNEALQQVSAKYYVLLNSDVEVGENWLEPLHRVISQSGVAAVQPKILAHHNPKLFEHAGAAGGFMDKNLYPFCRGRLFGEVEEDRGQYDGETEVFWTSGACMLIRSEVFHELGGFDADFFAHMEEIDLCWRMKRLGYRLKIVPSSVVFHVGGGTLNYNSPNKVYLNFRNSLYMITKNYGGFLAGKLLYRMILDGIAGMQFPAEREFPSFLGGAPGARDFLPPFFQNNQKKTGFSTGQRKIQRDGFLPRKPALGLFFQRNPALFRLEPAFVPLINTCNFFVIFTYIVQTINL